VSDRGPEHPPEIPRLDVCAETKESAIEICEAVNLVLRDSPSDSRATWTQRSTAESAGLEIQEPVALLFVRKWPSDVDIVWQGRGTPPRKVMEFCGRLLYDGEAPVRAFRRRLRKELDERRRNAPKSVAEAVERLCRELGEEDKATIRSISEEDLGKFHHGWGMGIRNAWVYGNSALIEDSGVEHPDDVSEMIIRAVWKRLVDDEDA